MFKRLRYLLLANDPVHIGTGGYRLGRVDNSIVREPGNRIPKIPGTSLHGAARHYAARLHDNPAAAGQSQHDVANPAQDPICYTFGYVKTAETEASDAETDARAGVVHVFDGLIVLFPVHTLVGPVWVTTQQRLQDAGFTVNDVPTEPETWPDDQLLASWAQSDPINLGWLMLHTANTTISVTPPAGGNHPPWSRIQPHIVLVKETLFTQVVNSNLEVRTSVSIDPKTGAAKDGALFTYEAIPRGTLFTAEVVIDDYRLGEPNRPFPVTATAGNPSRTLPGSQIWDGPQAVYEAGLDAMAWLGIGGMGTRGFGRISRVGSAQVVDYPSVVPATMQATDEPHEQEPTSASATHTVAA